MGRNVTYNVSGGGSSTVRAAIFSGYAAVQIGEPGAAATEITALVSLADVPAPKRGDTIVDGAVTYKVRQVQLDSAGDAYLILGD